MNCKICGESVHAANVREHAMTTHAKQTNETPTPRTDAQYKEYARRDNDVKCVDINFARQLERELTAANQRIAELEKDNEILDWMEQKRCAVTLPNFETHKTEVICSVGGFVRSAIRQAMSAKPE